MPAAAAAKLCGAVIGWFPTVPRGEIEAALNFILRARPGATHFGDCKYVIDALRQGVPPKLRSSASVDADLWRTVRRALGDRGNSFHYEKVKAHRSRAAAETEGEVSLTRWKGNDAADNIARGLARTMSTDADEGYRQRERYLDVLTRIAMAAAWALRHWPEDAPKKIKRKRHCKLAPRLGGAAGQCGPHVLRARGGGGFECTLCRLRAATASSIRSLRTKPCRGDLAAQAHPSHQLRWSAGVTWCGRCGGYTSRMARSLRQACAGVPSSQARRNVLNRLRRGLAPTTASYLEQVKHEASERLWREAAQATAEHERAQEDIPEERVATDGEAHDTREHARGAETDLGPYNVVSQPPVTPPRALPRRRVRGKQAVADPDHVFVVADHHLHLVRAAGAEGDTAAPGEVEVAGERPSDHPISSHHHHGADAAAVVSDERLFDRHHQHHSLASAAPQAPRDVQYVGSSCVHQHHRPCIDIARTDGGPAASAACLEEAVALHSDDALSPRQSPLPMLSVALLLKRHGRAECGAAAFAVGLSVVRARARRSSDASVAIGPCA